MERRIKKIFISILIILPLYSNAQDYIPEKCYNTNSKNNISDRYLFSPQNNPAIYYYNKNYNITELNAAGFNNKSNKPVIYEEGDRYKGYKVEAKSYMGIKPYTKIWGQAYYLNSEIYNIKYNETSHYKKLYPYLMSDTIGGNINNETYFFEGGLAKKINRITWGTDFSYMATLEYRAVDPRPKNTAAEIHFSLGAGYDIEENYVLSLSGTLMRYKQANSLEYYNETGVSTTYHRTGMGTDYYRFKGTHTDVDYKGTGYNLSMDLIPLNKTGIYTSLKYGNDYYKKILCDLNNLVMSKLRNEKYSANIIYAKKTDDGTFTIKTGYNNEARTGTENIFGDAESNIYPKIAEEDNFLMKNKKALLSVSGKFKFNKNIIRISPGTEFYKFSMEYKEPERKMETEHIGAGINIDYQLNMEKSFITMKFVAKHVWNTKKDNSFEDAKAGSTAYDILNYTYNAASSNITELNYSIRYDFSINEKLMMFLNIELGYTKLKSHDFDRHDVTVSTGLVL